MTRAWTVLKESVREFICDDVLTQAASLSFYAALALAPLVLLILAATPYLPAGTDRQMLSQMESIVGDSGAAALESVVSSAEARKESAGFLPFAFGLAMLLFSSSGVFAQLQATMNRIWNVRRKKGAGPVDWLRKRLLSISMVLVCLVLLAASVVITSAIEFLGPEGVSRWSFTNAAVAFLVFTAAFMAVFRFLPDVRIAWRDVWFGAVATSLLFSIGKHAVSLYISHGAVASSYGAAGSLAALLVWVYYSAIIVLFGAEVTQVYARHFGKGIRPDSHAEWIRPPAEAGKAGAASGEPDCR